MKTRGGLAILLALAAARLALHCATNWHYGFHRNELAVLDDARFLDWGYVSYPPFTPFLARVALILFGPSLGGLRFFAALAQSVAMVVTGLMARELGGWSWAQVVAALAAAVSPMSICMGTMFQDISFDLSLVGAGGVLRDPSLAQRKSALVARDRHRSWSRDDDQNTQ